MKLFHIAWLFIFANLVLFLPVSAYTDEAPLQSWRGGPQIGISPYTGVIGGELQKGKWALTMGLPAALGVRYYFAETGTKWFIGTHGMWYKLDDQNEEKDGIRYTDVEDLYLGAGFGYKWRFKDHWDLVASLSLGYHKEELTGKGVWRTTTGIAAMPGLSVGYSF